jgi:hypothetical protein
MGPLPVPPDAAAGRGGAEKARVTAVVMAS